MIKLDDELLTAGETLVKRLIAENQDPEGLAWLKKVSEHEEVCKKSYEEHMK